MKSPKLLLLGITSLPTLVLYKGDKEVWKKAGVTLKSEIQASSAESLYCISY